MYVSYFFVYQITIFLTLPKSLNDLYTYFEYLVTDQGEPGSYKNDYNIYYSIQPRILCFLNPPAHLMLQGCDRQATPEGNGNPPSHHRLANCHPPTFSTHHLSMWPLLIAHVTSVCKDGNDLIPASKARVCMLVTSSPN